MMSIASHGITAVCCCTSGTKHAALLFSYIYMYTHVVAYLLFLFTAPNSFVRYAMTTITTTITTTRISSITPIAIATALSRSLRVSPKVTMFVNNSLSDVVMWSPSASSVAGGGMDSVCIGLCAFVSLIYLEHKENLLYYRPIIVYTLFWIKM